ncbi:MAG: hypothetical protein ACE5F9_08360 [Phycisphaerae bacterium]
MTPRRYRWIRRLMIVLAAVPLLQFAQCATGVRQVFAGVANAVPATVFGILQSTLLSPIFALLSGGGGTSTGGGI